MVWLTISLSRNTCRKQGKHTNYNVQGLWFQITIKPVQSNVVVYQQQQWITCTFHKQKHTRIKKKYCSLTQFIGFQNPMDIECIVDGCRDGESA